MSDIRALYEDQLFANKALQAKIEHIAKLSEVEVPTHPLSSAQSRLDAATGAIAFAELSEPTRLSSTDTTLDNIGHDDSIFSVFKSFDEFCAAQSGNVAFPGSSQRQQQPHAPNVAESTASHELSFEGDASAGALDAVEKLMHDSAELAVALQRASLLDSAVDIALAAHSNASTNGSQRDNQRGHVAGRQHSLPDRALHEVASTPPSQERSHQALHYSDLSVPSNGQIEHRSNLKSHDVQPNSAPVQLPSTTLPATSAQLPAPYGTLPPHESAYENTTPLETHSWQQYPTAAPQREWAMGYSASSQVEDPGDSMRELTATSTFVAPAEESKISEQPNLADFSTTSHWPVAQEPMTDDRPLPTNRNQNWQGPRLSPRQVRCLTSLFQGYMVRFLMRSKKIRTLIQQILDVERTLDDTVRQYREEQSKGDQSANSQWTRQFVMDLKAQVRSAKVQLHDCFFRRGLKTEFFESLRIAQSVRAQKERSAMLHDARDKRRGKHRNANPVTATKLASKLSSQERSRQSHQPQHHASSDKSRVADTERRGASSDLPQSNLAVPEMDETAAAESFIPGAIRIDIVEGRDLDPSGRQSSPLRPGASGAPFCKPQATMVLRNRLTGTESKAFRTSSVDGGNPVWKFSHKFTLRSRMSNYDVVVRVQNCDRFVSETASGLGGIEISLADLVRPDEGLDSATMESDNPAGKALYGSRPFTRWYTLQRLRRGERIGGSVRITFTCLPGPGAQTRRDSPPKKSVEKTSAKARNGGARSNLRKPAAKRSIDENERPKGGQAPRESRKKQPFLKRKSKKVEPKKVDWSKVQSKTDTYRHARRRQSPSNTSRGRGTVDRTHHGPDERSNVGNFESFSGEDDDDAAPHRPSEIPRWNGRRWQRGNHHSPDPSTASPRSRTRQSARIEPEEAALHADVHATDPDLSSMLDNDYVATRNFLFPSAAPPVAEGSFFGDDADTVDGSSSDDDSGDSDATRDNGDRSRITAENSSILDSFSQDSYSMYRDFPDDYDDEYEDTMPGTLRPHTAERSEPEDEAKPRQDVVDESHTETSATSQRLQVDELERLFDHLTRMSVGAAAGTTYADSVRFSEPNFARKKFQQSLCLDWFCCDIVGQPAIAVCSQRSVTHRAVLNQFRRFQWVPCQGFRGATRSPRK